ALDVGCRQSAPAVRRRSGPRRTNSSTQRTSVFAPPTRERRFRLLLRYRPTSVVYPMFNKLLGRRRLEVRPSGFVESPIVAHQHGALVLLEHIAHAERALDADLARGLAL